MTAREELARKIVAKRSQSVPHSADRDYGRQQFDRTHPGYKDYKPPYPGWNQSHQRRDPRQPTPYERGHGLKPGARSNGRLGKPYGRERVGAPSDRFT